ncbi:hypothetical protein CSC71_14295 [Pseudoxanthomonas sangjuensis]|uniref:hypothetical protein n=1 Tax=Pseudoxanthomonas sangjuensis TaxID=1503750 RepID=UPI001390F427|nr:hypothetical protein [Pseudoxanthomonas sangjuensis]KAF1706447.1 hypothetical protein CSC71_14295 [Pseudoxanthomonas sangjuensis]
MNQIPGHDDYLWDRSGPVDAGVAELERLLAPQGWRPRSRVPPRRGATAPGVAPSRGRRARRWRIAIAGAAAIAAFAIGVRGWYAYRLQWPAQQPWRIAAVEGEARVDGRDIGDASRLAPGAVLETGAGRVRLRVARIGEVGVGEGARFRIVDTRSGRHRTQLQHGSLWARVWAPPGALGVATPAGDVLDLGCEFTMRANADGSGTLAVRSGWVQVESGWREVLVPQGARVEFAAHGRPGTPYDEGASDAFVAALRTLDAQDAMAEPDAAAVRALAAAARPQDAISLMSLLRARPQLADGPVFDRMSELMPADARVARAAVRAQVPNAMGPWWEALPYPRIKRWWTQWPDALPSRDGAEILQRD